MTTEALIVVLVRLAVPVSLFRWPLAGALLSLVADALDIILIQLLDLGGVADYQRVDKYLDSYYLTIEAAIAQRWPAIPRTLATVLFVYRMVGVVLFEMTNIRVLLFVFPNLFENFFLFYLIVQRFFPRYRLTPGRLAAWLAILLVPKMAQEYVIHYAKLLDDLRAVDIIADVTHAITDWLNDRLPPY